MGVGTAVKVFLPAIPQSFPAAMTGTEEARVRGGTETILLVEDEAALRGMTRIILQRHGYRVLEAGSGVEALKVWETHAAEVGLLLTDMIMPDGLTGRELAKQLLARKPGLKVIYVSGYSIDTEGTTFRMREGVTYLQKPYHPKRLAEAVREKLDRP